MSDEKQQGELYKKVLSISGFIERTEEAEDEPILSETLDVLDEAKSEALTFKKAQEALFIRTGFHGTREMVLEEFFKMQLKFNKKWFGNI
jgi:hypothetical protein